MTRIASVPLTMERQTKGAVLYSNKNGGGSSPLVTSIYLRKEGFPTGKYPGMITLTIESDEDLS
jgi:hypothetical protein